MRRDELDGVLVFGHHGRPLLVFPAQEGRRYEWEERGMIATIAGLIDDWFYRTATDFRWDMHAPVSDGETLYARYTLSYRSTLPEANNARVMFEGVSIMKLRDGLIAEYHEVANTAPGFVDMNFAPERIAKIGGWLLLLGGVLWLVTWSRRRRGDLTTSG